MNDLIEAALSGQRRAIARLISAVEDDTPQAREIIAALYPHTGRAHTIGITGAPGSGKSTLVAQLAAEYRRHALSVGIVAVDPSSPFSGGALLGDRIRMRQLSGDPGIYIRSMATRGSLGGLARATADVVKLLDACGFQRILIETVGAGQAEVDIARAAHTTLVIQVPGMGDDVQMMKAGILEIADILVVNKADHPGAERTLAALQAMLDLALPPSPLPELGEGPTRRSLASGGVRAWRPPVLRTIATLGQGIVEAVDALERHMAYLCHSGLLQQRERLRAMDELRSLLRDALLQRCFAHVGQERYDAVIERIVARKIDVYAAVEELIGRHP